MNDRKRRVTRLLKYENRVMYQHVKRVDTIGKNLANALKHMQFPYFRKSIKWHKSNKGW